MAEIKKSDGQLIVDYTARDYDSLLASMRQLIPYKMPEWTDYESEADLGNVLLQLFAHMGDVLSYYQDRVANESFLGTAQTRRSIIHHLRLIGYRLSTAAPASAELTVTLPGDWNETLVVRRGDAFATKSRKDAPAVRFEYNREQDLTIEPNDLQLSEDQDGQPIKIFESIPVEEGRLITEELLGVSDGTPDQSFPLAHRGLILRSLGEGQKTNRDVILRTHLAGNAPEWTLRETLAFSHEEKEDSEIRYDFIVDVDENDQATVRFGDGVFGAIPMSGSEIRVTYRVGGGARGNVPSGAIDTVADAPQLSLAGAKVTNPRPATGGAERESIEHAVKHAPGFFRSYQRAVTAGDYEALARDFSGVGKVRARGTNWNTVTLYVAPEGGGHVSDVLEANLLAYFEDKRTVTTIVEIEDVDYVSVYVTAEVRVLSYHTPEVVEKQVEAAGAALLAFDNVDFGRPVLLSKFYEAIEAIDGVEWVYVSEFRRSEPEAGLDGEGQGSGDSEGQGLIEARGRIDMGNNEIPVAGYAGGIQVVLRVEEEA